MTEKASEKGLPVAAARSGDPAAWEALFRRYRLPLYVFIQEMIGNEQLSLDVVQETFLASCRHLHQLKDDHKFGSWLFGIAHQKCMQFFRGRKDGELYQELDGVEEEDFESIDPTPVEWAIRAEEESVLMEIIAGMPEIYREPILLHWIEDFSMEEIASILGVPAGTVKSRIHKAKVLIRRKWSVLT